MATSAKSKDSQTVVIMVPLPAQSHLNQLLQLAGVISGYDLPVHYVGSATHNRQAKTRANNLTSSKPMSKIQFHDLQMPPIESPDPNPNSPDKHPNHLGPAIIAYMGLRQQIGTLVRELSQTTSRTVIIYDRLVAEAVSDAVTVPNVEAYAFTCFSAFHMFRLLREVSEKPFDIAGEIERVPSVKDIYPEPVLHFVVSKPDHFKQRDGDIYNTSRLIEGKYIDLLVREELGGNKKHWAITPTFAVEPDAKATKESETLRHICLKWLDKQPPRSVMYVSFGTCTSLSDEEAGEIALGLEQSKQKFLWVLRDADRADIFVKEARHIRLPQGFEERVRGDGLVMRDWAPQLEILSHGSIGGFMTHCGWNSCFESLSMGVPIAAWPMHSDQPFNAIYFTEFLNVGVAVREWDKSREMMSASEIKKAVERLIASEEGDNMRKRAEGISTALQNSIKEGGELCREIKSFIAHITR